jgi:oxygen-independent coproporphyrinogen-3 oxidase
MVGLYIHIPFCASKCAYCDFYSVPSVSRVEAVVDALKREMTARAGFLPTRRLDTIYTGGGTPSLLAPERLQSLLDHAATVWDCSQLRETTLEANPEDLTDEYLARLAETTFNRLSIGVQSFDDGLLRLMNRRHSAARAREAVRAAQKQGFRNITTDLIFGIPGMTHGQWERTLDEALGLGVQHISAYHLTIEPATAFGRMARESEGRDSPTAFRPIPEAESERQYGLLRRKLQDAGFEHYEISNFALPGFRAVHNSAYWSGAPYLGVGPSAHSYDGARRREWVAPDLKKYIAGAGAKSGYEADSEAGAKSGSGSNSIYNGETLSDIDLFNERLMTSLRTAEGIDTEKLPDTPVLKKFLVEGLLVRRKAGVVNSKQAPGERIAIPPEKFLLSDYIISSLFLE